MFVVGTCCTDPYRTYSTFVVTGMPSYLGPSFQVASEETASYLAFLAVVPCLDTSFTSSSVITSSSELELAKLALSFHGQTFEVALYSCQVFDQAGHKRIP